MSRLCSYLTAASLFIHAALGCCWHHAHTCAGCGEMVSLAAGPASHARLDEHPGHEPAHPGHGPVECTGTCIYMSPARVQVQAPMLSNSLVVVPSIAKLVECDASIAGRQTPRGPNDLCPGIRRHLLDQVLLI